MVKEISCPEENLENFILYGEQIPYYKFIHGEPDKRKVDKKTRDYYHKGKKYAEQFKDEKDSSREFMVSLRAHIGVCKECSERINELREKYKVIGMEELRRLTEQQKDNLKYFDLLE